MAQEIIPFISGYLSQWYRSEFKIGSRRFNCAEQYMMYAKARLFGDAAKAKRILKADHPKDQKRLGRAVQGFDQAIWDAEKYNIVLDANRAKFSQNRRLGKKLLSTGDAVLVEGNVKDPVWGVALRVDDPRIFDPAEWRGENLLGKILMQVRSELADKADPTPM